MKNLFEAINLGRFIPRIRRKERITGYEDIYLFKTFIDIETSGTDTPNNLVQFQLQNPDAFWCKVWLSGNWYKVGISGKQEIFPREWDLAEVVKSIKQDLAMYGRENSDEDKRAIIRVNPIQHSQMCRLQNPPDEFYKNKELSDAEFEQFVRGLAKYVGRARE